MPSESEILYLTEETAFSNVMFIENMGQWDERAAFQVWGGPGDVMWIAKDGSIWLTLVEPTFLTDNEPDLLLYMGDPDARPSQARAINLHLTFPGANPHPRIEPFRRLSTVVSYFTGRRETDWHPAVPVWGGVRVVDVYPGMDLELVGEWSYQSRNEDAGQPMQRFGWRLVCRRRCTDVLENLRLRIEGAKDVHIVRSSVGREPYIQVDTDVGVVNVPLLFVSGVDDRSGQKAPFVVGTDVVHPFGVGTVPYERQGNTGNGLAWSTFLGGNNKDAGTGIDVDNEGNVYVIGETRSWNFPNTSGYVSVLGTEAFLVKLSNDGRSIRYVVIIGGNSIDVPKDVDVDEYGNAFVVGYTASTNFPLTRNSIKNRLSGYWDGFLVKVNSSGQNLSFSTYFGGSRPDRVFSVKVRDYIYLAGYTVSSDFPITPNAPYKQYHVRSCPSGIPGKDLLCPDGFVSVLSRNNFSVIMSTFMGGIRADEVFDLDVDSHGDVYVIGYTASPGFPVTNDYGKVKHGSRESDVFVTKLTVSGHVRWITLLGGARQDVGYGISVGNDGKVIVTGYTWSSDWPVTNGAIDRTFNSTNCLLSYMSVPCSDAFLAALGQDNGYLLYSTFVGGSREEWGTDVHYDGNGTAYVVGRTRSSNFPVTHDALDRSFGGGVCDVRSYATIPCYDAFLTVVDVTGSRLLYATYLGGKKWDEALKVALSRGYVYLTGITDSMDFPSTAGAYDTDFNGATDTFVSVLDLQAVSSRPTDIYLPLAMRWYVVDPCSLYEPNDDRKSNPWGPLHLGVVYRAYLCQGDIEDNYYFQVSDTRPIRVQIRLPYSLVRRVGVWIYWEYSLATPICGQSVVSASDIQFTCQLSHTGRYILQLYSLDWAYYDNRNPYELLITR